MHLEGHDMNSKIALITGGSRGLGKSTALHLAAQGVGVVLTYLNKRSEADKVVAQIQQSGQRAVALPLDVGHIAGFGDFVGSLQKSLTQTWQRTRFDHLVNNAGHGEYAPFGQTTEAQFDGLVNAHFKGPFFLTQALLPLIENGGRIINVSTGLTRFSSPGYAAYASAKGGLEVMTHYLAKELGPRGITANVVAPGAIETDFGGGGVRDNAELNAAIAAQSPMGRVGLPDDIGGAIASLLGEGNRWVTGQRIEVSGGIFV
jgi:NAD(P)-dependent dehydrogenase (short-subunit alcohol dehydrogenase family)